MEKQLLLPEVQEYLHEHLKTPIASFALANHPFEIPSRVLTQQLAGMQTAAGKFPDLAGNDQVLYPPKLNLEQTSSTVTASYKASLVRGDIVIDLTGGFGIDSSAFAKAGKSTTHIEQNAELQNFCRDNYLPRRN